MAQQQGYLRVLMADDNRDIVARSIALLRVVGHSLLIGIGGGFTKDDDRIRPELNGFDDYLIKPVDPNVVLALLAQWTEPRAGKRP